MQSSNNDRGAAISGVLCQPESVQWFTAGAFAIASFWTKIDYQNLTD